MAPPDGKLACACWCGEGIVLVPADWVGKRTGPCYRRACRAKDVESRKEVCRS